MVEPPLLTGLPSNTITKVEPPPLTGLPSNTITMVEPLPESTPVDKEACRPELSLLHRDKLNSAQEYFLHAIYKQLFSLNNFYTSGLFYVNEK